VHIRDSKCNSQSIHSWLDYRAKKVDKPSIRSDDAHQDPYAILLSKLTGVNQKPAKLLAGWQRWSKDNFEQHREEFEEYFKASGKTEKQRASTRQEFIRDLFSRLSDEEQSRHTQAAIDEHRAAQKALKEKRGEPPSEDPRDRQQ
jgi:hypothetical protein